MSDRLRIVNLRWPRPPAVLADFSATGVTRDTFAITPGDTGAVLSAASTRWGGARVVTERRQNSTLSLTMFVAASATITTANAAISVIQNALETALAANMPDLAIEWRPDGASYSEFWRLRGPATYKMGYSWAKFSGAMLFPVDVSFPVAPLGEGAPYDIFDDFGTDSIGAGDYVASGPGSSIITMSSVGGTAQPSAATPNLVQMRHTRGYLYGDVEVSMKFTTGSTVVSGAWGVFLGMDPANPTNYLRYVFGPSGCSLDIIKNNLATNLSTAGGLSASANTTYYLLMRRFGNVIGIRVATSLWQEWTNEPDTYTLTGADLRFAAPGYVGFTVEPAHVNERYDDFSSRPFCYRNIRNPEQIRLAGPVVGDAPALVDLELTPATGVSTLPVIFGLASWCDRPQVQNLCWRGNLTQIKAAGSAGEGWGVGAVSGVIAAATGTARATDGLKYGTNSLKIQTPATTDTGSNFPLYRRFKKGGIYAMWAWLSSVSQTTSTRIKLGVSGDIAVGTAAALSATPKLYSVVWRPAADVDVAYGVVGVNAATATFIDTNGTNIVEVPTITLAAAINSSATSITVWYTPSEAPYLNPDGTLSQPFLALIDQEFVLVTAISGSTWTVGRGAEGTTAASHLVDAYVIVAPPSRQQFEGKGAQSIFGVIEAETWAQNRVPGTITADTNYRAGNYVIFGGAPGQMDWYVDPSSIMPDDFTQSDVLVDVWARIAVDPAMTGGVLTAQALPSETWDPDTATASLAGVPRYTLEYGAAGVALVAPTGTGGTRVAQFVKLGTVPFVSDRSKPQRNILRLAWTKTGGADAGIDYLLLTPIRSYMATPTGKASADATYPTLMPPGATAIAQTLILRADGSALVKVPRTSVLAPDPYPAAGLGPELELPNTDVDLMFKFSQLVPNDPGAQAMEMFTNQPYWTAGVHAAVTPRFATARGA